MALARVFGVDINGGMMLSMFFSVFVLSVGAPGVPGAGLVCLSVLLTQLNVPLAGIGLVMGLDSLLGMMRAMSNSLGDVTASLIVAKSEKKLDMEKYFYRPTLLTVLPFIGAFAARLVFIVGDGVAWLYKSLFFIKRPARFNSKEEDEFALYEKPQKAERVPRGISYSLLLFVIGMVAVLYFVLLVAFN